MRKRAAEVIGDCIVVEKVALTLQNETVQLRPLDISLISGRRSNNCWRKMKGKIVT